MFDKIFKTSFCCQNCNLTPSDIYIRFRYLFICKDRKKKVLCFLKYISITLNYNSISYFYAQCFIIYIKKKKFLATSGRLIKKNAIYSIIQKLQSKNSFGKLLNRYLQMKYLFSFLRHLRKYFNQKFTIILLAIMYYMCNCL